MQAQPHLWPLLLIKDSYQKPAHAAGGAAASAAPLLHLLLAARAPAAGARHGGHRRLVHPLQAQTEGALLAAASRRTAGFLC